MTRTIDLDQEQLQMEDALALVEGGDNIVMIRGGEEVARIGPGVKRIAEEESRLVTRQRVAGLSEGWVSYIADDFDAELPDSFWLSEE